MFNAYFAGVEHPCPNCGVPVDWWKGVRKAILENFILTGVYQVVGAQLSLFRVHIKREATIEVDFVAHGVPEDATILSVNYTPEFGLFPVEIHGNTPVRDPVRSKQFLYGASFGRDAENTRVNIAVTWIRPGVDEVSVHHLVDAAQAFVAGKFRAMVVPANVGVESAFTPAITDAVSSFCSSKQAEDFLANNATYSHQLNVLGPIVAHLVGAPRLPESIRGTLNRLRKLRNEVGHQGKLERDLDRPNAAELLAASLFGYRYAQLLHDLVRRAKDEGRLPV